MSNETVFKESVDTKTDISVEEADLIWDEYKYRHDHIWRHLIRSTIAVVALITVSYSSSFKEDRLLYIFAALLAIVYTGFSLLILRSELVLYERVKVLHRKRQNDLYKLHIENKPLPKGLVGHFPTYARWYLIGLLALAIVAFVVTIIPCNWIYYC